MLLAGTVLPHDQAVIAVSAAGLSAGTAVPFTIELRYGKDRTVRWTGTVSIPAPPSTRIVHTGNGAYTEIPQGGSPGWAIALIIVCSLLIAGVIPLLYRLRRLR